MIDEKFKTFVEDSKGCAVIMAGSGSDDKVKKGKKSHIENIINSLEDFSIPYRVRICSAHKQSKELIDIIGEYNSFNGPLAIIAVAGGTDALSGIASYHSLHPIISCPPDTPNNSCLTNPPRSSNAYIPDPKNVGKFVAQMFSHHNQDYRDRLIEVNQEKIKSLKKDDERIREKYNQRMQEKYGGE